MDPELFMVLLRELPVAFDFSYEVGTGLTVLVSFHLTKYTVIHSRTGAQVASVFNYNRTDDGGCVISAECNVLEIHTNTQARKESQKNNKPQQIHHSEFTLGRPAEYVNNQNV